MKESREPTEKPYNNNYNKKSTSGSWWCSACSRAVRKGTVLRGCRKCDYDLCSDCFEKLRPEPEPLSDAQRAARKARKMAARQQQR